MAKVLAEKTNIKPSCGTCGRTETVFWYAVIVLSFIFQGAYFSLGASALAALIAGYVLLCGKIKRADINLAALLIIAASALLSLIFLSLNKYTSFTDLLKYLIFPLSYMAFSFTDKHKSIENAFFAGMIILLITGIGGCLGMEVFSAMVTEKGGRLQSFLQYANTTALFMAAGCFISADRFFATRKIRYIILGILFALAIVLTKSRITFVLFLLVLTAYMLLSLKGKNRITVLLILGILLLAAFIFGGRIIRISLTEPTLVERFITYSDAAKEFVSSFGAGMGLGNWQFLSHGMQSAPYMVRYIHNMFLQMALDGGLPALVAIVVFCAVNLFKNRKSRNIYYYIFLLLILHSFFEINMNYGIFNMFFVFSAVMMNQSATDADKDGKVCGKVSAIAIKAACLLCAAALSVLFVSECFVEAGNRAMIKNRLQSAEKHYSKAIAVNPYHYEVYFKLAQIEQNPEKAIELLEKAMELNPYGFSAAYTLAQGYMHMGHGEKAVELSRDLLLKCPYNKEYQMLNKQAIGFAYNTNAVTEEEHGKLMQEHNSFIAEKNSSINPLYRYIDPDMDY